MASGQFNAKTLILLAKFCDQSLTKYSGQCSRNLHQQMICVFNRASDESISSK